ncbi:RagB/SusD family nutrient uptake outer membrane protein [Parabacteroides pacaensis]|uniref:RagB/SusD family nutrient uptake outer membrane protein n=1 Tax=Parabacteroides pacaensis TaxID=2086575 RepID=UPI000D114316|nr:RagB/SusD family nutrient uptake outer membrane protein [Parabacteroides pacaensis]
MKSIYAILIACSLCMLASCDYLDVVPESTATEDDIYKTQNQTQKFVYSCYRGIPDYYKIQEYPDFTAGNDLVTGWYGSVRYFHYKSLLYGLESPSSTYYALWSTTANKYPEGHTSRALWTAIRYCYNLINNLERVADITEENMKNWKGEALFLIAYYHQIMLEYYGPVIIVDKEIPLDAPESEMFVMRSPYDKCVEFIADKYTEAATLLPAKWTSDRWGRATAAAALGYKARLLLYAASPLVNGNSEYYSNFKNPDGENLMNLIYDKEKWKKAMDAAEEAILYCEQNGYKLYESVNSASLSEFDRGKRNYHAAFVGEGTGSFVNSDEMLFGLLDQESVSYNSKNFAPRIGFTSYTTKGFRGYAFPTWDCISRYYTKNGLPWEDDPETKDLDPYSIAPGDSTVRFHRNREPRFYASVGFDRGEYEVSGDTIILRCRRGEMQQNDGNITHEYQTDNGYYCQKWISKNDVYNVTTNSITANKLAFPYLRLAELYLSYAEADFEYNGSLSGKSLNYLNKVRQRCGLPNFETSWAKAGGIPSGEKLRQILHDERTNELAMEGRRFHDIRRWKIAHIEMMRYQKSWNLAGKTAETFYQLTDMKEGGVRVFEVPKSYWLAIPLDQIQVNYNLVQNPGYGGEE